MPPGDLLDDILPEEAGIDPQDGKPRHAVVSTIAGTYSNNPTPEAMERLSKRCQLLSTEDDLDEGQFYIDYAFEGHSDRVTVSKG